MAHFAPAGTMRKVLCETWLRAFAKFQTGFSRLVSIESRPASVTIPGGKRAATVQVAAAAKRVALIPPAPIYRLLERSEAPARGLSEPAVF
jgi:hypothetical protein